MQEFWTTIYDNYILRAPTFPQLFFHLLKYFATLQKFLGPGCTVRCSVGSPLHSTVHAEHKVTKQGTFSSLVGRPDKPSTFPRWASQGAQHCKNFENLCQTLFPPIFWAERQPLPSFPCLGSVCL